MKLTKKLLTGFWYSAFKPKCLMAVVILGITLSAYAQQSVSGVVKDEDGNALSGVTVSVLGSAEISTQTDQNGWFTLAGAEPNASLLLTYVGMAPIEYALKGQGQVEISIQRDAFELDEVVVVGYGTVKKRDVTGAVGSITSEQILANPSVNAVQSIQGRVAGVDIAATGHKPGDAPAIRIRGNRSVRASNDPLYVVDGIPFMGNLNDINSSDIESIDILKDASATAIYGSRGANGVVLITTKRGTRGAASINYGGYYGMQSNYALDIMNGEEFVAFRREARRNIGRYDSDVPSLELDKGMFYYPDKYVIESVSAAYDEQGNYDPSRLITTDWVDAISRVGAIQDHQLNINGGNEQTTAAFSAGYFNNKGTTLGFSYERFSLRAVLDQQVKSWLKMGATLSASINAKNETDGSINALAYKTNPLNPLYDENGILQLMPGGELTANPKLVAQSDKINHKANRFYGSFFTEVNLLKGLRYRFNFGPDYKTGRSGVFNGSRGIRLGADPIASSSAFSEFHYTLDNLLYYDLNINDVHNLSFTALHSMEQYNYENLSGSVQGLPYEYQEWYNLGSANTVTGIGSSFSKWRLNSYMVRLNYSLNSKYLLTATGRWDGSSRLAAGHKYSFFPSLALAWNIKDEPFMQTVNSVSDLKLRVGYGRTGNTSINPYETLGSLARTSYSSDDAGFLGYSPNLLFNPDLGWETTGQYNIGVDLAMLSNRLFLTLDAYKQDTENLLLPRQLPIASGFSSITQNIGATRNTGIEASLSGDIVRSKGGFTWNAEVVFTKNKEEIVKLYAENKDDIGNRWFIGQPINTFFDYKFDGIWQNTEADLQKMAEYNTNGSSYAPGEIRVWDKNGDNKITADDRDILGSTVPKWSGSLNSRFSYKNVELAFLLFTRRGQMLSDMMNLEYEGRYNWLNVDYWTPDNPSNSFPRPVDGRRYPLNHQTLSYQDGSFMKLKTVTLGYTFSDRLLTRFGASRLRVYATAQNPFMVTPFRGIDPEGATGFSMPSVKTFLVGASIAF